MNISSRSTLFRREGYFVERDFLKNKSKTILQKIEASIDNVAESINVSKELYLKSVSRWDSPNEHVDRLANELSGYIQPPAEECFGQNLKYVRASIIRKLFLANIGTHGHQDAGYWGINSSKIYDVSTWVALEDINSSNSALRIIPGSHYNGAELQGDFLAADFYDPAINWEGDKTLDMSAGDVAIFDPYLWHASHPCSEGLTRVALVIRWCSEIPIDHSSKLVEGNCSKKFGMSTSSELLIKALDQLLSLPSNKDSMIKKIYLVLENNFESILPEPCRARSALEKLLVLSLAHEDHYGNDGGSGIWLEVRDSVINPLIDC